jgi:hypothetical protein
MRILKFFKTQTSFLRQFLAGDVLPSLEEYDIKERPRRNVQVTENRSTKGNVVGGKEYVTQAAPDQPQTFETVQANKAPDTPNEVVLDAYDIAFLDDVIGAKWRKDESRAKVIKWFWLNGKSSAQIEQEKTDRQTKKLERGYSERTVSDYIKAFYDADEGREKDGKARIRNSRTIEDTPTEEPENVVEW